VSEAPSFHWHAEVQQLRAASSDLVPAAKAAVRSVLLSVLAEEPLEPSVAASARSLLAALGRLGAPVPMRAPRELAMGRRPGRPDPAR
jgi:hypothetical protein